MQLPLDPLSLDALAAAIQTSHRLMIDVDLQGRPQKALPPWIILGVKFRPELAASIGVQRLLDSLLLRQIAADIYVGLFRFVPPRDGLPLGLIQFISALL